MTLDELLVKGVESKNAEIRALAKKVKKNWDEGVTPSAKQIDVLAKMIEDFNSPCIRLTDDGRCNGWLAKYGQECRIPAKHPFQCPFAGKQGTVSQFPRCPGYRTMGQAA
jgi:hypothetical protein